MMNNTTVRPGHKAMPQRWVAGLLCIALMNASTATAQTEPEGAKDKLAILGLVGLVGSGMDIYRSFSSWVGNRVQRSAPAASPAAQGSGASLAFSPDTIGTTMQGQGMPYNQAPSFSPAPLIMGQPDIPLLTQPGGFDPNKPWDSKANYQGVAVSAVMLDAQNRVIETRSLAGAFRSGERFKLRLVSTSDAIVSLDALRAAPGSIGPNGVLMMAPTWGGQLYPARADQVVQIKPGDVVHIPLGANEYFTFDNKTGTELLSLNVRHPQAGNQQQMNRQPVYRQDAPAMTTYSQLAQEGSFLALTQVLALQHGH